MRKFMLAAALAVLGAGDHESFVRRSHAVGVNRVDNRGRVFE
jgi:hypothetical protein